LLAYLLVVVVVVVVVVIDLRRCHFLSHAFFSSRSSEEQIPVG
jgi:hypothetical protein